MKSNDYVKLVLILLIVAFSALIAFFPTAFTKEATIVDSKGTPKTITGPAFPYRLGLDLKGGIHVVLDAIDTPEQPVTDEKIDRTIAVLESRINKLGLSETTVQRQGKLNRIAIDLPGYQNKDEAMAILGKTALLQFKDADGKLIMTGDKVKDAQAVYGQAGNSIGREWHIVMTMTPEGQQAFTKATEEVVARTDEKSRYIAIYLDDELLMKPNVKEKIDLDTVSITSGGGDPTEKQAWSQQYALLIAGGALPLKLSSDPAELRVVGASLGQDTVNNVIIGAILAMILVGLYMLLYYKGMGLVSILALGIYGVIYLTILLLVGQVFSLPAIGGAIISIGMAVDSNVIIFERVRDEINKGKLPTSSVSQGFGKALGTVLDSNITTLIGAGVLYWLGTGPVKGFAVTLALGIFASFFTAVFVTRFIMDMIIRFWKPEPGSPMFRFFYGNGGAA